MLKEFREFIARGSVIDLAVGIIVGGGFGKIVASLVSDVVMPPLGLAAGKIDFSNLFINLSDKPVRTLAQAKAEGVPTINYGVFIDTVLQFFVIAFVVFLLVKGINKVQRRREPKTKECPFCAETIPQAAKKCGRCTSDLAAAT
jgi:large conductance mechanosensitive channel